jgi:hypothetical protein
MRSGGSREKRKMKPRNRSARRVTAFRHQFSFEYDFARPAEPDAGDEAPPRFSARSGSSVRACRSRSGLHFRRRSLSFSFGEMKL